MNYLGSRTLETENLILKAQTIDEQKKLWEILMNPNVNRYYLTVPVKFRENLKDWNKQKKFYESDIINASDNEVFKWSIFLKKSNLCIGRIPCHKKYEEDLLFDNFSIRGVGWFLDPIFQGKGYGTEAATTVINYMFLDCNIEEILTGAAICNPASWKIMEKLGFQRLAKTKMIQYTFLNNLTEIYVYRLTKENYLSLHNQPKRK